MQEFMEREIAGNAWNRMFAMELVGIYDKKLPFGDDTRVWAVLAVLVVVTLKNPTTKQPTPTSINNPTANILVGRFWFFWS